MLFGGVMCGFSPSTVSQQVKTEKLISFDDFFFLDGERIGTNFTLQELHEFYRNYVLAYEERFRNRHVNFSGIQSVH